MAALAKLLAQGVVVLDAAVVDDGDAAGAVEVGVGVELRGGADGGPAGVADADGAGDGAGLGAEVLDVADGLGDMDAAAVEDGDAAGVVAAVLDAVEGVQQDGEGVSRPDVARDSAHRSLLGSIRAAHEVEARSMADVDWRLVYTVGSGAGNGGGGGATISLLYTSPSQSPSALL